VEQFTDLPAGGHEPLKGRDLVPQGADLVLGDGDLFPVALLILGGLGAERVELGLHRVKAALPCFGGRLGLAGAGDRRGGDGVGPAGAERGHAAERGPGGEERHQDGRADGQDRGHRQRRGDNGGGEDHRSGTGEIMPL
jgi:hypothetical protein